ncbi:MAG TPA: PAS domain-containing sensor histidine kinase [Acidobacteriaceae bacterium]|nr:PAS domain-containing sensor histidine kinase [Acidobacteriaceae bacterium]
MQVFSMFVWGNRKTTYLIVALMIGIIGYFDANTPGEIPLGFLYMAPMLVAGASLTRWEIGGIAVVCAWLAEAFDAFLWGPNTGLPRDLLYFSGFLLMGLFMHEVARSRRLSVRHMREVESEVTARRDAEEQLKVLIASSPAAIITTGSNGRVLLANDAADRLFGMAPGGLAGQSIRDYLPSLVNVPALDSNRQVFRTAMQCRGRRADGEVFQADVWFSTYATSAGPRLAAMVLDTSEELRTHEEASFHQMLASSRIMVAAVSHEVRNVCGAIALVHESLTRAGQLKENKDFETLGTLITALERIAAMDLRQTASQASTVEVAPLLDELRIVIESSLRDNEITSRWEIENDLPHVWADRQSLMQVFLNLTKNSERAMVGRERRELTVSARHEGPGVVICFRDTGGGVTHPERLFRPFQQDAQSTGLGLYLSRAFMRSFKGDLHYEPETDGSMFVVELSSASRESKNEHDEQRNSNIVGRRPQSVPREPQPASSD